MRSITVTKSLIAAVANTISHSQSLAAAGYLTLTASPVVLDSGRQVIITSAGDDSGLTWTVIGTDDNGNPIKDIFAGANGIAASNLLNFKTVTSIYGSGATAAAVTAGTNGVGSSVWFMFSDTINTPNMSFDYELLSGAANVSIQYTQEAFLPDPTVPQSAITLGPASPNPVAHDFPNLSAMAASYQDSVSFVFRAWRVLINSGTGSIRVTGRQAGLASP